MNDSGPGPDEVGSVAEEAAKLIGALSSWARDHGEGLPSGLGHGLADAAHGLSGAAHNVNEHFATGGEDCTYCPICRGVRFVRGATPEVRAHLLTAASSLLQAGAVLMATQAPTPEGNGRRTSSVEHIVLDGDLPNDGAPWPAEHATTDGHLDRLDTPLDKLDGLDKLDQRSRDESGDRP